jgi:hypothetical protein
MQIQIKEVQGRRAWLPERVRPSAAGAAADHWRGERPWRAAGSSIFFLIFPGAKETCVVNRIKFVMQRKLVL